MQRVLSSVVPPFRNLGQLPHSKDKKIIKLTEITHLATLLNDCNCTYKSLAYPRRAPGTRALLGVQILSFSCSFRQKLEK